MRFGLLALVVAPLLLVSAPALAVGPYSLKSAWPSAPSIDQDLNTDTPPAEVTPKRPVESDLSFSGYVGGFGSSEGGGPMVLAALSWRRGLLQLGVGADAGAAILDYDYFGYSLSAGLGWRSLSGWQLDAVGYGGVHSYEGFGRGLLSSDPGARATLPFAGVRVGPSYTFGAGETHFAIGLVAFGETDLSSRRVTYDYVASGLFESGQREQVQRTVWTARGGAMLRLGVTHDLL